MVNIGIIGATGYWGLKILRELSAIADVKIKICSGKSNKNKLEDALGFLATNFAIEAEGTVDYNDIISSKGLDAVIVSTPAESHYEIVAKAITNGLHTFVEKPFTLNTESAQELSRLARDSGKILFVDYTYLHSACMHYLAKKVHVERLKSKILHMHVSRTQCGIYRLHNVLWDLAPHDISIFKFLFPDETIKNIEAIENKVFSTGDHSVPYYDSLFYRITLESGSMVTSFISWCYPKRYREITITSDNKMILFENNKDVTIYEHNLLENKDNRPPDIRPAESYTSDDNPLRKSLNAFIDAVHENSLQKVPYYATAEFACEVTEVLEKTDSVIKRSQKV